MPPAFPTHFIAPDINTSRQPPDSDIHTPFANARARHRPPTMGCMLDKPICSKTGDAGEGNSLRWAVASMQGWRCEMEDTHAVRSGLYQTCAPDASVNASTTSASGSPTAQKAADDHPTTTTTATVTTTTVTANDTANSSNTPASSPAKRAASPTVASAAAAAAAGVVANATGPESKATFGDWSFFAVFDGHAGERSAVYSSKHLLDAILSTDAFQQGRCVEGIRTGFLGMDEALRTSSIQPDSSGSTAIAAFVSPQHVYLANCGDSRAIFCRNGAPAFSTQDHKPVLPGERERILKAGGSVIIQRVNGSLAVSRALGDFEYKNVLGFGQCAQLVSPEPEVFCIDRDLKADQFMVLACDGIWDVMSNEDVCAFVASRLRVTDDLRTITNAVIDTCFHKVKGTSSAGWGRFWDRNG